MAQAAGCVRFVWNKALAEAKERLEAKESIDRYASVNKKLTRWKKDGAASFLKEPPSQPLQMTLRDLDRAWQDCFKKKKGVPRFKKKGHQDGFCYPVGPKIEGSRLCFPKIGWVCFRKTREIEGKIKNTAVSKRAGEWYVALQVEIEVDDQAHPNSEIEIGIDLGIARFATLSDGSVLKPHNSYRKAQEKLGKAQRALARKKTGSVNRLKQKWKVQRLHKKIAAARLDYLHKATTWIAKNHGKVILEDLKVSNMSRSAKGTLDKPGRNVSAKSGLNKSILDQGWFEFKRQLGYKLDWLGGELILVNPKNTSRCCQECGHVSKENRKSQASFECVSCGHKDNADLNAAKNILTVGQTGLACGSNRKSGRKQEPLGQRELLPV